MSGFYSGSSVDFVESLAKTAVNVGFATPETVCDALVNLGLDVSYIDRDKIAALFNKSENKQN